MQPGSGRARQSGIQRPAERAAGALVDLPERGAPHRIAPVSPDGERLAALEIERSRLVKELAAGERLAVEEPALAAAQV